MKTAPLTSEAIKLIGMLAPHSQAVLVKNAYCFLARSRRRGVKRSKLLTDLQRRDLRNWWRREKRKAREAERRALAAQERS
jgi:hypothetical protein